MMQNIRKKPFLLTIMFFLLFAWGRPLISQTSFEKGKVIDKVICQHFPSQSYALYLPQEYTPLKSWPILYAFDPSARGEVPVEHFKKAAEEYDFIVVGSNNVKNDPWEEIFRAMQVLWSDTQSRFHIDLNSIYSTGFSGGARAAVLFSRVIDNPVAGIIGCGAGFPSQFNPEEIDPSVYYGIAGIADFNYREMLMLDKNLDQAGVTHYIHYFEGRHDWPSSDVCLSSWEWMEIMRMKQYIVPEDKNKIKKIYRKKIQAAKSLERQGKIYWAVLRYQGIISLFSGTKDTSELEEKIMRLKQSDEYKQFIQHENERLQKESQIIQTCGNVFSNIERSPQDYSDFEELFAEMKLGILLEEAQEGNSMEDKSLAVRLLHLIFIRAAQTGNQHLKNNHPLRAVILFQVAQKASQGNEDVHKLVLFDLAQAYALKNDKEAALQYLELAVQDRFRDLSAIENSPYFNVLRQSSRYQKIIEKIKKSSNHFSHRSKKTM